MSTRAFLLGPYDEFRNMELSILVDPVTCGTPPAPGPPESMKEKRIQLSDLVDHPTASYLWRAYGDSMVGAGIYSGDILLIDKYLVPAANDVVIAAMDGEPMVKRLTFEKKGALLLPENPGFDPVRVDPEEGFRCLGVVTYSIHPHRGSKALSRKLRAG